MLPKVSVIVCTYNQESTIGRALDSILVQQVDFPYEIILADDCSADATPSICADYAYRYPDRIRLFLNPVNKGVVDNYFDCIEAARGQYIADLAGDDEWTDPHKLARQAALLDSDPRIVLCHAAWQPVYPDGTAADASGFAIPAEPRTSQPGELTLTLLRHEKEHYFIHLCTAMYRRDTILGLMHRYPRLFRNPALTCEDLQINVLMSRAGKIAYTPEHVLNYTVGAPSVSSDENPLKTIRFYSGVISLDMRLCETLGIDKTQLRAYLADTMQYIIMQYFVAHSRQGRSMVRELLRRERIPLSLKNRITLILASNPLTWSFAATLRRFFKK